MNNADKLAIQQAKASSWKKILLWSGIVLVLCTGITILLVIILRRKDPVAATQAIIGYAKHQSAKADIDAKIATAKARFVEDAVVDELKRIREIQDEEIRAKRLAALL